MVNSTAEGERSRRAMTRALLRNLPACCTLAVRGHAVCSRREASPVADTDLHEPLRREVVPFLADDGLPLNLVHVRGEHEPGRGAVILVHGAGVRANVFQAPVSTTLVDLLVEHGFDVWLENWRASIDVPANDWTLDQAALYDHPAAVRTVLSATGADRLQAVIHCQGSTSFTMSAIAGLVPQVDTIVSNAVSLHPVVPRWSRLKLRYALPVVGKVLDALDPAWGDKPPGATRRALTMAVKAFHRECDNTACRLVSFTYGSGFPALWRHENLNAETHDQFIPTEFGRVPMTFFRQIAACVRRGNLISVDPLPGLLSDYAAAPPQTDARFVFLAGEHNRCFLPESQVRSFEYFDRLAPRRHALHVLPGYSHLDVFFGRHASRTVLPLIVQELEAGARST
jgi:hypothetical protein